MRDDLYRDDRERALHEHVIHAIAMEAGLPDGVIGSLYERELEKLKAGATVMEFLPLLIQRRLRETLHIVHRTADAR